MDHLPLFEIKEISETGTFHGIASIYGVEDLGGDVIEKGAFKKTIAESPSVPILWQHKSDQVIGMGTVKEHNGKLLLDGTLDMDDDVAVKAFRKMKAGMIKGLSIGFSTIRQQYEEVEGKFVRHILELKLWEVSVVTFPMLPSAQVTRVKSQEALEERMNRLEAEFQALQAKQVATPVVPAPAQAKEPPSDDAAPQELHSALEELRKAVPSSLIG